MILYLTNDLKQMVPLAEGLPLGYDGKALPGGKSLNFLSEHCELVIQDIITDLYSLRLNFYRFFTKISINIFSKTTGLRIRVIFKGALHDRVKDVGNLLLNENEFSMLWSNDFESSSLFEKDKEYRTLDIFYSPELVKQLSISFPQLAEMVLQNTSPIILGTASLTYAMQQVINQILDCSFDDSSRQFYIDLKVREFLFLMLEQVYSTKPLTRYRFTDYEKSCIVKAREILLKDLKTKPLSLSLLSKAAAINEFKLKVGFQQIFGMSVFNCLFEARMDKAKQLLLTTNKPIKEICTLSGYPRMTNFITAFRKRFGYTPGSLRRS